MWPWGDTFDPERCNCVESGWGWTVPVRAHPKGAAPGGAEQLAGNVWEWVGRPARPGRLADRPRRLLPRHRVGRPVRPSAAGRSGAADRYDRVSHRDRAPGDRMDDDQFPSTRSVRRCVRCTTRAAPTGASASSTWAWSRTCASVGATWRSTWSSPPAGARSSRACRPRSPTGCRTSRGSRVSTSRSVWDPVWTQERLSESAREKLALPLEELIPYREQRIAQEKGA